MQCPSCQKEVSVKDKDVGALFTCPQCRSVYFINFDGSPDFGEIDQPTAEELEKLQNHSVVEKKKKKKKNQNDSDDDSINMESEVSQKSVPVEFEIPAIEIAPVEAPALEMQPLNTFESSDFSIQENQATEFQLNEDPPPIEALPTETPSIENFSYESQPLEVEPPSSAVYVSSGQDFASIASEIESFGNEDTAVAGISYDLEITGLDTKESQELLREAINDSRFGWHTEDIIREIKTGTCQLKNLTPVQAFVIARRIQFIDVDMKWKQNVLA